MKEALIHSKITFELILKTWILTDKQKTDLKSNIDYLNEVLLLCEVIRQSEQLVCKDCGNTGRSYPTLGEPDGVKCESCAN